MPGRLAPGRAVRHDLTAAQAVLFAACALLCVTALDLLHGSLGIVFSVGFTLIVILVSLWVGAQSLFTPGVLPPVLMLAAITLIAALAPSAIDTTADLENPVYFQRVLAGLLNQATALVIGHIVVLIIIAARRIRVRPARR